MYNRSLSDPDGHIWEAVWMNPAEVQSEERASREEAAGEGEGHFSRPSDINRRGEMNG